MKAIIIESRGVPAIKEINEPCLRSGYLKVKTVAIALNPTDVDHIDALGRIGGIVGCDYAGVVHEVGENCEDDIQVGDRIYGVVHGANMSQSEDGAFAEFVAQKSGLCAKILEGMSFETAASLGVAITSNAQALYESLALPLPGTLVSKVFPILVYGGSTSQGTLAIQLAKMSGWTVVTTASPHNFDLVKSRGADAVFDYHDPECGIKIREYTGGMLRHVFDTIALPSTAGICAQALAAEAKNGEVLKYTSSLPIENFARSHVVKSDFLAYTATGEGFEKFGIPFPPMPDKYEFAKKFWKLSGEMVREGKLLPHPIEVREGGFGGALEGLHDLRAKRVSGRKLVYRVD